mmetsp:Transcript_66661/g.216952  ORF Transcript_66661/g.216952 Transcript_66661/m.216952 type:complete len:356 (+) Transcript_66661:717-1784(+)
MPFRTVSSMRPSAIGGKLGSRQTRLGHRVAAAAAHPLPPGLQHSPHHARQAPPSARAWPGGWWAAGGCRGPSRRSIASSAEPTEACGLTARTRRAGAWLDRWCRSMTVASRLIFLQAAERTLAPCASFWLRTLTGPWVSSRHAGEPGRASGARTTTRSRCRKGAREPRRRATWKSTCAPPCRQATRISSSTPRCGSAQSARSSTNTAVIAAPLVTAQGLEAQARRPAPLHITPPPCSTWPWARLRGSPRPRWQLRMPVAPWWGGAPSRLRRRTWRSQVAPRRPMLPPLQGHLGILEHRGRLHRWSRRTILRLTDFRLGCGCIVWSSTRRRCSSMVSKSWRICWGPSRRKWTRSSL